MALPATDSFTNTNGTTLTDHSANWTLNGGNFAINTNAVYPNAASTDCGAHWNADAFADDQYAQGVVAAITFDAIGVAVRAHASANSYYGLYGDSNAGSGRYLFKEVAGTWTQIAQNTNNWAVNDVVRLEVSGTTLTPKINGATDAMGAQTDSSFASGSAGLSGWSANAGNRLDDWEAGNLGAAPATIPYNARRALLGVGR